MRNLKEKDNLRDAGLKWEDNIKKETSRNRVEAWNEYIWLRTGTSVGLLLRG